MSLHSRPPRIGLPACALPSAAWDRLDESLARFEAAWRRGERPCIDDYLASGRAECRALLTELAHAELELRLRAGEPARAEDYLARYPELGQDPAMVLDLVAAEYRLRCRAGEAVTREEYLDRFRAHADALKDWLAAPPDSETYSGPDAPAASEAATLLVGAPAIVSATRTAPGREVMPAADALPAALVPGYEVLGVLGKGGMGVVYQARHVALGRLVALKVLPHAEHAGADALQRFEAEAVAVARLNHPHVVQVYEIGECQGLPYFAMEYCEGGSLDKHLDGTPWQPDRAAALIETLAGAVHAAHGAGVVHRDLKPGNVLLSADGTLKVTDFGLAKRLDVEGQTRTGVMMGTPSYMAPEQAGQAKDVGPAADVYALGAILYELLTGRPPFKGATDYDTILQVVSDEPVPVRRLQPKAPKDLETVCHKCLEKDPRKRYASAAALGEDLRRFGAGESVSARPVGAAGKVVRWGRRRPAVSALLVLVAVVTAAGTGGMLWSYGEALRQSDAARRAKGEAESKADEVRLEKDRADQKTHEADTKAQQLERTAYLVRLNQAHRAWLDTQAFSNVGIVERLLDQDRQRPQSKDLRGFEWYYLDRLCHQELLELEGTCMAFSPDGKSLASGCADGTVRIWDAATGRELFQPLRASTERVSCIAFSPDGKRLAAGGLQKSTRQRGAQDAVVKIWPLPPRGEPVILKGHFGSITSFAFSPDGRQIAIAFDHGAILVKDSITSEPLAALQSPLGKWPHAVAFSPNGKRVAMDLSSRSEGWVQVWDWQAGQIMFRRGSDHGPVYDVAFSPNGKQLVSAMYDGTVMVREAQNGRDIRSLRAHRSSVMRLAFARDGRLATASDGGLAKVWHMDSGQALLALNAHAYTIGGLAFSPDGKHLATASGGTVKVWDAHRGQETRVLRTATEKLDDSLICHASLSVDPDNRHIAVVDGDRLSVWDMDSGQRVPTLGCDATAAAFSPDGKHVACASAAGWLSSAMMTIRDMPTGRNERTQKLNGAGGHNDRMIFSPDGNLLAGGFGTSVRVWDVATGREQTRLKGKQTNSIALAFSPDGRRLAISPLNQPEVGIWDLQSGRQYQTLKRHLDRVGGVAFSPDGAQLATASWDRTLRICDAITGVEKLPPLRGHGGAALCVAYHPKGKRLASGSWDQTVRVWDTETGEETLCLYGHTRPVRAVAFSPDGNVLVSTSDDGTVRIWDARPVAKAAGNR